MSYISIPCILISLGCIYFGFQYLTDMTMGVGILAIGCIVAILARIDQADFHYRQMIKANKVLRDEVNIIRQILAKVNNVDVE